MADDGKKPGVGPEDTGLSSGEEMKKNGGKKGEEMKKKEKNEESGYTLAEFIRDLDAVVVDDEFGSGGEDLEEADGHSWKGIEREEDEEEEPCEEEGPTVEEQMESINGSVGWSGFKARMEEVRVRAGIGRLREAAGLKVNPPRLHTAIIGNAGCGKGSCAAMMARLYCALGLLDSDKVWMTGASELVSCAPGTESDTVISSVRDARGCTLVIENADSLYRTDNKGGYDAEGRVLRAIADVLVHSEAYGRFMLVLTGEPEGMENLLAACPEIARELAPAIYLEDFTPDELFDLAQRYCAGHDLSLSEEAQQKLRTYLLHRRSHCGNDARNIRMINRLFEDSVIPAMCRRIDRYAVEERTRLLTFDEDGVISPDADCLRTVCASDIPSPGGSGDGSMAELDALVGLEKIKSRVRAYLNAVRLAARRMELGLATDMPRLHMAFLGNPGTGKTTLAEIIGRIFASWGILSGGRVIRTEKSRMVGQYIGETEYKMTSLLERARGNILFIDEAYQLVEGGERDFGRIVMNSLLTELGKDNCDMVVILAGYTAPMKKLLESNGGIESRFPNVFNFEDYTADELVEIGKLMAGRQGFSFTEGALENMRTIIREEAEKPSPRFGNGRFISNLLQNEILASLGARTAMLESPDAAQLSTILPEDVAVGGKRKYTVFDDVAIDAALARLDALVGMEGIKKAIHDFVTASRYLHSRGESFVGKGLLCWRFIGRSGTGKSAVASIMAEILRGMRLIANHHITEIKGERIFNVSERDCDEVLEEAVKKSCNGLIFIDMDESKFTEERMGYGRGVEQVLLKVKELTLEAGGECAVILAELDAPNSAVARDLRSAGVYEFDHTLIFNDFTPDELFRILCSCLGKFELRFNEASAKHMRGYLNSLCGASIGINARTMKLMSRTILQQVALRESAMAQPPAEHIVSLADIGEFRWDGTGGKIGF